MEQGLKQKMALAERLLEEARDHLAKGDPIQASEKLYKAAEEAVKLMSMMEAKDIYGKAEEKGRWTVALIEKAVEELSVRVNPEVRRCWDAAWALHVWGFHEERFDIAAVKARIPDVEKILNVARGLIEGRRTSS